MASKSCRRKSVGDQMNDSDVELLAELSDSESWVNSSSDTDTDTDLTNDDSDDSNRYKEQQSATLHRKFSRSRKWEPVTKNDIWNFLGLIILQGVVKKPLQKWYWSTNKLLETPFFGTVMTEYRFSLIMKFLHFTNNEEFDETTHPAPKLKKIWEVFQMVVKNFQQTYVPKRDISIDESLMAYKGRLSWIQYIASKRARFGIKSYMLCESSTNYIWNSLKMLLGRQKQTNSATISDYR
ncbi:piggyBac transposable element-derived protein 4-like [Mantella aurantiaca]